MSIHKEGYIILITFFLAIAAINLVLFKFTGRPYVNWSFLVLSTWFYLMVLWFFRDPTRELTVNDQLVIAPADGKIVVVEETNEPEFLGDKRIQVSIFMSPLNVHVNRYPVSGVVRYYKYHPGKYLVAWHPKSSTRNERTTTVIERADSSQVLVRQIAGAVARRIVCYAKEGESVTQGTELGFIKFGSRVDIFLPPGTEILVKPGDITVGNQTVIARFN